MTKEQLLESIKSVREEISIVEERLGQTSNLHETCQLSGNFRITIYGCCVC